MKRSQFDEDDILQAILKETGSGNKRLVDIGARLLGSNAAHLIEDHGWSGTLVDADMGACTTLEHVLGKHGNVRVRHDHVDIGNINEYVDHDAFLLLIDIDSNDFWVWANVEARPAIVVIETNPEPGLFVAPWPATPKRNYGMSIEAAVALGKMKGYYHVGDNGCNSFFVRDDLRCEYRVAPYDHHRGIAVSNRHANVLRGEK